MLSGSRISVVLPDICITSVAFLAVSLALWVMLRIHTLLLL